MHIALHCSITNASLTLGYLVSQPSMHNASQHNRFEICTSRNANYPTWKSGED